MHTNGTINGTETKNPCLYRKRFGTEEDPAVDVTSAVDQEDKGSSSSSWLETFGRARTTIRRPLGIHEGSDWQHIF